MRVGRLAVAVRLAAKLDFHRPRLDAITGVALPCRLVVFRAAPVAVVPLSFGPTRGAYGPAALPGPCCRHVEMVCNLVTGCGEVADVIFDVLANRRHEKAVVHECGSQRSIVANYILRLSISIAQLEGKQPHML